jgi:oligoribonuclease
LVRFINEQKFRCAVLLNSVKLSRYWALAVEGRTLTYSENLVWMDLEMTGLDPEVERILEVATIITDSALNIIAEGPVLCVAQPESLLAAMDEWNTSHHTASGLVERVRREGISEAEAEAQTLAFIQQHVEPGKSPLCGNSIAQDRRFLVKYMPVLEAHLHYRNIDVSTVKELAVRWRPDVYQMIKKQGAHRAVDDIRESISELQAYRKHFFQL